MPTPRPFLKSDVRLDPVFEALNSTSIAFSIKSTDLGYIYFNENFSTLMQCESAENDFDIFIPEVAYELGQEENEFLITQNKEVIERILITKGGNKIICKISRSFYSNPDEESDWIVTVYEDITAESQERQFEAFQQVLSKDEVFEKIINQFSNFIFRSNDQKVILTGVSKLCVDLLNLEDISIFTVDDNKKEFKLRSINGKNLNVDYSHVGLKSVPIDSGIIGKAYKLKEAVIVDDVSQEPAYLTDVIKAQSEISVPIVYKNRVLGIIDSESSEKNNFNSDIKRKLESIASLLAIKLTEIDNFKKLRHRDNFLTAFIKANPSPLALLDTDLNFIEESDSWSKRFDYDGTTSIGKNITEINANIDSRSLGIFQKALRGKRVDIENQIFVDKNGVDRWVNLQVSPWFESKDVVGGILLQIEDITEIRNQNILLNQSQEELQQARLHGKISTYRFCPFTGHFDWLGAKDFVLPKAKDRDYYTTEEVFELIPEDYRENLYQLMNLAINEKKDVELVHPFITPNGKRWVHNKGTVILKDGELLAVEGVVRDITNEINAEKAYEQKVDELSKLNSELDQFVYKTAHDLRAPLTNVLGLINVMKNVQDPALLQSYLDLQEKSVNKLDEFILKIGSYTKNTRLPLSVDKVNMGLLIDEVLNSFLYAENSDNIKKIVKVEHGALFYTDQERIKTILNNLVSNAIQFADLTKKESMLTIDVSTIDDFIQLKVKDNGLGVSNKVKQKVFDMFFRGSNLSTGAGIGLYIVKETVSKLNGRVDLESIEKESTTITIKIPNILP